MQTLSEKRLGRFTASSIHKLFTGGATKETYIFEKAEEIVKGHAKQFSSKHTEHGHMHEFEAIQSFGEVSGLVVEYTEQEYFPINENCGSTPDAKVVDFSGNILASADVKCPTETFFKQKFIHLNCKLPQFQNVPKEMFYQGQMQMMSLGVEEHYLVRYLTAMDVDFDGNKIEYNLPLNTRLFYQKIRADNRVQEQIIKLVEAASIERDLLVKIMKQPIH